MDFNEVIERWADHELKESGKPNSKEPAEDNLVPGVNGDDDARESHNTNIEERDEKMEERICSPDVGCALFVLYQQVKEESESHRSRNHRVA
jgi:hypothetical protein